ncbi:MAG: hypothetical protein A2Z03_04095 [Chloroflexi bacterium RBG_16_56_8]|nr:MAG: hypothetical protein A2Z03_04095 [Chloroflexi bacterium RBG_16_56_8]
MDFDPVTSDPIEVDWQYPTANAAITFGSGGSRVLGVLHLAQGAGPHPTVILLHGIPGYERGFDLSQILRRAGWNVLVFHYRGSWGSQGAFSFQNVLDDVRAALAFLRSENSRRAYRVDGDRIVLIGHSLGSFAALTTAIADSQIRAVITLALYDLGVVAKLLRGAPADVEAVRRFFGWTMPPLQGTSTQNLMDEILMHADAWYLPPQTAALADRSLLLIAANRDTIAPAALHHTALLDALKANNAQDVTHVTQDSDHAFANKRIALARTVLEWLKTR